MACKGWRAKTETLPKEESAMRAIWSTIIISWFSAGIAQPVSELERAIATWTVANAELQHPLLLDLSWEELIESKRR